MKKKVAEKPIIVDNMTKSTENRDEINSDAVESSDAGENIDRKLGSDGEPEISMKKTEKRSNERNIKQEVHDSIKVYFNI